MAKDKKIKKLYKDWITSVDATEEQLNFLIECYSDEDSIVGIHNTYTEFESFFDIGLRNQTSMGIDSNDLSNTVMYSDIFASLMVYPNGDGKKRGNTAIILKIPKGVFLKEQGIFEKLSDGMHGIPPQFIVGAFQSGKVFFNNKYDKDYKSEETIKCIDNVTVHDKQLHIQIFKKIYNSKKRNIKDKLMSFMKKIGKGKNRQLLLNEGTTIDSKDRRDAWINGFPKENISGNELEKTEKEVLQEKRRRLYEIKEVNFTFIQRSLSKKYVYYYNK